MASRLFVPNGEKITVIGGHLIQVEIIHTPADLTRARLEDVKYASKNSNLGLGTDEIDIADALIRRSSLSGAIRVHHSTITDADVTDSQIEWWQITAMDPSPGVPIRGSLSGSTLTTPVPSIRTVSNLTLKRIEPNE